MSQRSYRRRPSRWGTLLRLLLRAALVLALLAAIQYFRPLPVIVAVPFMAPIWTIGGAPPDFPWPSVGVAAVAVSNFGLLARHGDQNSRPMASAAKIMTALVLLADHPLAATEQGSMLTITAEDEAAYQTAAREGQSVLPVRVGEELSEYQLLQALLIPSANNIAAVLARWDAGSEEGFVAKLNARAGELGMVHSHYADASGLSPQTTSTPEDLIRVGEAAMANSVFAAIVAQPQVSLPEAGTLYNVNSALGQNGIVGIKTGSTLEAGACFVFFAKQPVGVEPINIYGAILGQNRLAETFTAANQLITATRSALHPLTVLRHDQVVAGFHPPWGGRVEIVPAQDVALMGWPSMSVQTDLHLEPVTAPLNTGTRVGWMVVSAGEEQQRVDLVTTAPLLAPPLSWRLTRLF